jgi:hypothetical protein
MDQQQLKELLIHVMNHRRLRCALRKELASCRSMCCAWHRLLTWRYLDAMRSRIAQRLPNSGSLY